MKRLIPGVALILALSLSGISKSHSAPLPQGKIQLLKTPAEAWYARYQMIREAKHTIQTQYFSLYDDDFGRAFMGLLLEKLRAGVKVQLMVDARGTYKTWRKPTYDALIEAGADVRVFNPILGDANFSLIASNHDKILLVDGKRFITGGRNIGTPYFVQFEETTDQFSFADIDIAVEFDESAKEAEEAFSVEFNRRYAKRLKNNAKKDEVERATQELIDASQAMTIRMNARILPSVIREKHPLLERYKSVYGFSRFKLFPDVSVHDIRVIDNHSRLGKSEELTEETFRLIREAKNQILIQNPYLVLTKRARKELENAANRGVQITFMITSHASTDSLWTQAILQSEWRDILLSMPGAKMFASQGPETLHAKLMVVDHSKAIVGTYNMDPLSENRNSEVAVLLESVEGAQQVESEILRELKNNSVEYDALTGLGPENVEDPKGEMEIMRKRLWIAKIVRPFL